MEDLLKTVRELKTKAKNRRDLERYASATSFLTKAIQELESALANTTITDWKSQIASELADCHGLLGGVYRRWGLSSVDQQQRQERLQASFRAYDEGYGKYEAHEEYKIANSYNRLNRLVSYLLFNPSSLDGTPVELPDGRKLPIRIELEMAEKSIRQQLILERRGDIWVLADLALVTLLLDRETPVEAYANFIDASPPDYAYDSALSVLQPLASLQLPVKSKLQVAVQLLEDKLQRIRFAHPLYANIQ